MIIYKATNKINNKVYIGQTVRSLEVRMSEHKRHNYTAFDKAINKYGLENFDVEVINTAKDINELNEKEIYWIKYYNCIAPNGYNQCNGGENTLGYHHKEESKKKMSLQRKGVYKGEKNPFFGKHHTKEQREKWSKMRKGLKCLTEEQIENFKKLRPQFTPRKVINLDTGLIFDTIGEAAAYYNLKGTHISRVCRGKRKTTGGYKWTYYDNKTHDNTVLSQTVTH